MLRSTSGFLNAAVPPDEVAAGLNPIQNTHFAHLKSLFSKSTCGMQDGKDAIELLDASHCFSADQKGTLRTTISCQTTLAGPVVATASGKSQSCMHFNSFLPEYLWQIITGGMSTKEKIFEVAKFCVTVLGLQHPKEKTKEKILQTMLAACNPSASAQDCKDCLKMLSQCIDSVRDIHKDKRLPITEYGNDPAGFIKDWPGRYDPDHLPVPSKVTAEQLHFMSLSTVCRATSKKLKSTAVDGILDAQKDKSTSKSLEIALPTHQTGMQGTGMQGNMQMMWNMMQFMNMNQMQGVGMQGNSVPPQHVDAPAGPTRPSRSRGPLALLDGAISNAGGGAVVDQQHGGALAGQAPADDIEIEAADAQQVDDKLSKLASLVGSVKSTKSKKKPPPVMKKPAAARAAVERVIKTPSMPNNLKAKFDPISYLDFKIYCSPGLWRALKSGEKVDKAFRHNNCCPKDAAPIWKRMMEHIKANSS